jgi:hypothetical protein
MNYNKKELRSLFRSSLDDGYKYLVILYDFNSGFWAQKCDKYREAVSVVNNVKASGASIVYDVYKLDLPMEPQIEKFHCYNLFQ